MRLLARLLDPLSLAVVRALAPSLPPSTSSSATAASSTAPARPGTPATSASATGASPRSAGSTGAKAKQTVDARRAGRGAGLHRHAGPVRAHASWSTRACRRRSSRGSRPRSPARAARPAPLNDAIIAADRDGLRPAQDHARLADARRSTTPGSSGRGSASTSPPTSAPPRCAGWCWATTTRIRRRPSSSGCGSWCARRCGRARSASPPRSSIRRRPTPRRRS